MTAPERALALVYRGPASLPGCPEAVADLIAASRWDLDVQFTGPRERLRLSPEVLERATLYAQPGGGQLGRAYRRMRRHVRPIRHFVRTGGRYLGFCLGGYLAGETPGFGLLPGDADQYISSPGARPSTEDAGIIDVWWAGELRSLYFQDGPSFSLEAARGPADVLAVYENGLPAAVVAPCELGTVGVVGPHPEATLEWFTDEGLRPPSRLALDLGHALLDRVMRA